MNPGALPAYAATYLLPYGAGYHSFQEEMIERTTHNHPMYATDNEQVYHIISNALADTTYLASIKRHRNTKDGRGAYLDLVMHHLGTNKWNIIASNSDKRSTTLTWNGRSHRYTLSRHINNLRSYHNDLIRCNDRIEYAVPTETQRVERLLTSIQSNDPSVLSAITTIRSSKDNTTGLYTDFERAADFLLTVAPKAPKEGKDHQISGLQQDYDSIKKPISRGPKTGVELRYHTQKEYKKLSSEEKEELRELRPPKSKGGDNNNKRKQSGESKEASNSWAEVGSNSNRNQSRRYKKANRKLESRIAALEAALESNAKHSGLETDQKGANGSGAHKPMVSSIQRRS